MTKTKEHSNFPKTVVQRLALKAGATRVSKGAIIKIRELCQNRVEEVLKLALIPVQARGLGIKEKKNKPLTISERDIQYALEQIGDIIVV